MKNLFNYKKAQTLALSGVLAFAVLGLSSCEKEDSSAASPSSSSNAAKAAQAAYDAAPEINIVGNGKFSTPNGVTYSNAGEFSFANTSGIEVAASSNINFTEGPNGPVISIAPSGGAGGGGGTVQAGKTNLSIDYAYCLSADDESLGFDADFMELGFDGISFVFGIDGDFDTEADPEEAFNGMAIYYVFDDSPNGSYDVFPFSEVGENDDPDDFGGQALAFVWDFENGRIFISSSGSLNVSGGSITFTGTYFQFDFDLFGEDDDAAFSEVTGLGTMGCE